MRGTLLVITAAAGAVVGAAVTHSLNRDRARVPTLAVEPASAQATAGVGVAAPRAADAARAQSTTAERAEIYRAAAAADSRELADMIHAAAEQPPSAARTFSLEALLGRYAEIDPEEAIAVAEEAGLDAELRAPLYAAWAATDSASALAALSEVNDPATARTIALALLPLLGGDERALRQVAAAVPFGAETLLYAEAIGTRAGTAPAAALEQALALTDLAARSFALERVAASWAAQDPRAALTAGDVIADPELRRLFTGYVGRQWVRLDPDGTLDYLAALGNAPRNDLLVSMGAQLAQQRPRELLSLAASLPAPTQLPLRTMAIQALANEDPALALREAEALPAGGQRESAIAAIARSYGARDPEGALAWAQASGEPSRLMGVLSGIAQRDPERAFDLAAALETPLQRTQAIQGVIMGSGIGLATNPATLADRVLTLNDTEVRSNALRMLLARWSSMAPADAADWLVTQQLSNVSGSYQQLATQLAQSNPAQAAEYTGRMPAAARSEWLQGVAQGYAQHDPQGAAEWLAQYRGDQAYAGGVNVVAVALARTDPPAAARLLATTNDPRIGMQAANAVASQWAQRDPLAAAAWAAEYDASMERPSAVLSVTAVWANSDRPAARAWVLRLPSGQSRDMALSAFVSATASETPDTAVLDAFSTPAAKNQAIINSAMSLANRDRAGAERLLDNYVMDAAARDAAKQMLNRIPPGAMFNSRGAQMEFLQGVGPVMIR